MKHFKELVESKDSIKVVTAFWGGAASLMRLLKGDEKKQFKSALGDIDNILSMTDLREAKKAKLDFSKTDLTMHQDLGIKNVTITNDVNSHGMVGFKYKVDRKTTVTGVTSIDNFVTEAKVVDIVDKDKLYDLKDSYYKAAEGMGELKDFFDEAEGSIGKEFTKIYKEFSKFDDKYSIGKDL